MNGIPAKNVTAASFQPKAKDMEMHPITLKIDISGNTPGGPKSSWSCRGSVDNLEIKVPDAFSSRSWYDTGCRSILEK